MLREIILENIEIENEKDILIDLVGKIIKVYIVFGDSINNSINVKLLTKEGEEVINIENDEEKKIIYPRVIINSGLYNPNRLNKEGETFDYFYCNNLLLSITSNTNKKEIINKILILYDDGQSTI